MHARTHTHTHTHTHTCTRTHTLTLPQESCTVHGLAGTLQRHLVETYELELVQREDEKKEVKSTGGGGEESLPLPGCGSP